LLAKHTANAGIILWGMLTKVYPQRTPDLKYPESQRQGRIDEDQVIGLVSHDNPAGRNAS